MVRRSEFLTHGSNSSPLFVFSVSYKKEADRPSYGNENIKVSILDKDWSTMFTVGKIENESIVIRFWKICHFSGGGWKFSTAKNLQYNNVYV